MEVKDKEHWDTLSRDELIMLAKMYEARAQAFQDALRIVTWEPVENPTYEIKVGEDAG